MTGFTYFGGIDFSGAKEPLANLWTAVGREEEFTAGLAFDLRVANGTVPCRVDAARGARQAEGPGLSRDLPTSSGSAGAAPVGSAALPSDSAGAGRSGAGDAW